MKRIFSFVVCVIFGALLLTSCTNNSKPENSSSNPTGPVAGTSQEDAGMIPLGTKVSGTVESGEEDWYAFKTEKSKDAEYAITLINTAEKSGVLFANLYDEEGDRLNTLSANDDGTPGSMRTDELEPNTVYYICLETGNSSTIDYTLTIKNTNSGDNDSEESEENGKEETAAGSNQTNAVLIPLGTKVFGTVRDNFAWYAFTTGDTSGATYNITFVNKTVDLATLNVVVMDEYGDEIGREWPTKDGAPNTIYADDLSPNTTYYIRINANDGEKHDFSIVIKDPDAETSAYKTDDVFSHAITAQAEDGATLSAGTNVNEATMIPADVRVRGNLRLGTFAWFGFKTEKTPGEYKITTVNATAGASIIHVYLYDEYGDIIAQEFVSSDGTPVTISTSKLKEDTVYYICLHSDSKLEYSLIINSPEEAQPEENQLVFEVPFEINETQVQFVGNKAVFIDEAKAKEVMKPVAEAILAHPDRSILIAGTTATVGAQETSVTLSLERAEAAKQLLVNTYNVPASQISVVGLGFEDDPFERGKDIDANGNLVESEARKNRRVVVLDAEDPIAQELLK